ncbi:MAG TPA: alcohol dehydrogenase catalytic domain-containing protein [Microvirga sp.]|jgi:propanol-preferring alcohol dehydrogenase|nr:alcohol dehydrogenase catalytic domain-containing protein [Microvirga sp.]
MQAAVLRTQREPLAIEALPDPTPGPEEVIIRIEADGICRSNWHTWVGDWDWVGNSPPLPICLGYKSSGTVEAAGPDVRSFRPDDRVLSANIWCWM